MGPELPVHAYKATGLAMLARYTANIPHATTRSIAIKKIVVVGQQEVG